MPVQGFADRGSSRARQCSRHAAPPAPRHGAGRCAAAGLLTLALLGGCSAPGTPESAPASLELRGHLSLGPHSEAFVPCGSRQAMPIRAPAPLDERLQAQYLSLVDGPYEEAFIHLRGRTQAAAPCAGCSTPAATLQIEQILDFQAAGSDDCR